MIKWKKRCVTVLAAAMVVLPMFQQVTQASNQTIRYEMTEKKALEMSDTLISNYGVSGIQYAIRDNDKFVLSGGIGVDEVGNKKAISKDTMFGIGSISKMYVTAATMMLADAGKLNIDDPLVKYIPEFTMKDERYKLITPRMLMNHSAGLYGTHYKNSILFDDNDTQNHDDLLKNLSHERLKSNPGEYSVYANDGFQLLEILVERVSGISYSDYLYKYMSNPLNLTSTKTPLDQFDRNRLYIVRFPGIEGILPIENSNVIGTGGIYATAEELTVFSDVITGRQPNVLSKASVIAMQEAEYRNGIWVEDESNIYSYGLGWDAVNLAPFDEYGIKALTKGGDTILYHSALIALPEEGISIALLTSGGSSIFNTEAATNILLAYLLENGEISEINPDKTFTAPIKKEMPESMKDFSGLYGTVGSTMEISIENGEIKLPYMMDGFIAEEEYVYTGNNEFTSKSGQTIISFDAQNNGNIYLRVKSYLEFPELGQTVLAYYESQKLNINALEDTTKRAWRDRNGHTYYVVDEKINSLFYLSPAFLTKQIVVDEQAGYANGTKIINKDSAVNAVEIPVMNGRDVFDLTFSWQDGVEYLDAEGKKFISETAIKPLYSGLKSKVTINASGDARWFKIDHDAAGKTITVNVTKHGGFAVYDENGFPVNIFTITGEQSVILPENGLIVFGGEAGDVLNITLKSK